MHCVIVGAGAMGSLFGGRLSSVTQVTLLDPWAQHVAAIQRGGLTIAELDGSETHVAITATTDASAVAPADLVILFVKSHATRDASEQALRFLSPAGTGPTHLCTRPDVADRLTAVAATLEQAGFEIHISEDLDTLVWGKLIINVGINALTAILRVPNGQLVEIPAASNLMARAVEEAVAVARAKGIELPYSDPLARVEQVARATGTNRSSMLQDVTRGAPTEIGVINEAIVDEGNRFDVDTPVNQALSLMVHAIQDSYEARVDSGA